MQMKSWILASVLGSAAALGCGDDDGGGGGSGVPGSKKVNELSAAEFKSVCEDFAKKFESVDEAANEAVCTAAGLAAEATDEATCTEARDECLGDLEPEEDPLDCDEPPEGMMDDCDATVAEFNACVSAIVDAFEDWAGEITCESDLSELEDLENSGPDEPPACAKLDESCGLRGAFEAEGVETEE